MKLQYDKSGLIPAIVQDARTGQVLMMAYMNRESLEATLREGRTCFYSRSRATLWRKGETSGNVQRVTSITADCDGDTLLVQVIPAGPACHTGAPTCFFQPVQGPEPAQKSGTPQEESTPAASFTVDSLYQLLLARKAEGQAGSYTTYLFEKGREKILKKVGEECTEVIIGAMKDSHEETINEAADLCYHMLVLLAEMGITPQDVRHELASRHVVDSKTKQEPMG